MAALRRRWVVAGAAALLATGALAGGIYRYTRQRPDARPARAPVRRGTLRITVVVEGMLKPSDYARIQNEVETQELVRVQSVVANGARVNAGDLLIEFEDTPIRTALARMRIEVQGAEAAVVQSTEELRKQELDRDLNIEDARNALLSAEQTLSRYVDLEGPKLVRQGEIAVARAEVARDEAARNLEATRELRTEDLVPENDVRKAEIALEDAEHTLEVAGLEQQLLTERTVPQQTEHNQREVARARLLLEGRQSYFDAIVAQNQANLASAQSRLEELRQELAKLEQDLSRCRIVAPVAGIVNYGNPESSRWRFYGGDEGPLRAGSRVGSRETMMYIPDLDRMIVEVMADEVDLRRLAVGQRAEIRVEAYPSVALAGEVQEIALAGAEQSWRDETIKFPVKVSLEGTHDWFRPDLKARVEVLVKELTDVLLVPVEAIFPEGDVSTVWVGDKRRPVEIGESNADFAEVKSGVSEGEVVRLTPP